ncbi:FAD-binding protein [Buttiauxella sp. S04-F03]|uniref:FAD-binding protein n=1 Tax=Buttiauxella sp. W03-F01 TaxID=2904524 RepID=UPI001E330645|nr:FAD-binding protein [Buttiauxella sp. W03-F01]MCE0802777.1 FAD-binding protein [Buttiauxella sp. W03-F01]
MEHYDIAIIGLGPAGATLARILEPQFKIIALDKKRREGEDGFQKPCGGLLAPDAQRSFIRSGINLPVHVLANPQIFSVKTIDLQSNITCNYQRSYININRHAFDLWRKTLIPQTVDVRHDTLCKRIEKEGDSYRLIFEDNGVTKEITAQYIVGADGANSLLRRTLYPQLNIRKYQAIQQWFKELHARPFYSCIFDNQVTDCYSWSMSKDGYFIFGGAFPMKEGKKRFFHLKEKMTERGFVFSTPEKEEKCIVLCPSKWRDFVCGKDNAFLIGEAAVFISASSLEGISYALDSAEILGNIFNEQHSRPNAVYQKRTGKIRRKLFAKVIKAKILTSAWSRKLVMKSRFADVPVIPDV